MREFITRHTAYNKHDSRLIIDGEKMLTDISVRILSYFAAQAVFADHMARLLASMLALQAENV